MKTTTVGDIQKNFGKILKETHKGMGNGRKGRSAFNWKFIFQKAKCEL